MIDIEKKGYIDTLKTTNEFVAREIVALQLESYLVESKIIGSNCIPTLYDTVDCIKKTLMKCLWVSKLIENSWA